MPKLVDYADRFDGIREAVYQITLEEGVEAISLDTVAPRAFLSRRTMQRMINSAAALPFLGLQWAERVDSRRALRRSSYRDDRPEYERAADSLIRSLPGDPDVEDRTVWWMLVTAFGATTEWARQARSGHAASLIAWSTHAVTGRVPDPAYEARRVGLLVDGAVTSILSGQMTHADAADLIKRHIGSLQAAGGDRKPAGHRPTAA